MAAIAETLSFDTSEVSRLDWNKQDLIDDPSIIRPTQTEWAIIAGLKNVGIIGQGNWEDDVFPDPPTRKELLDAPLASAGVLIAFKERETVIWVSKEPGYDYKAPAVS